MIIRTLEWKPWCLCVGATQVTGQNINLIIWTCIVICFLIFCAPVEINGINYIMSVDSDCSNKSCLFFACNYDPSCYKRKTRWGQKCLNSKVPRVVTALINNTDFVERRIIWDCLEGGRGTNTPFLIGCRKMLVGLWFWSLFLPGKQLCVSKGTQAFAFGILSPAVKFSVSVVM